MFFPRRKNYFAHFPDIHKTQTLTSIFLQSFLHRKIHCFHTKKIPSFKARNSIKSRKPSFRKCWALGKSVVVDFSPFFCSKWKVVLHLSISSGTTNRLAPCKFFFPESFLYYFSGFRFPAQCQGKRRRQKKDTAGKPEDFFFFGGGKGEQMRQPRLLLLFRLKEE